MRILVRGLPGRPYAEPLCGTLCETLCEPYSPKVQASIDKPYAPKDFTKVFFERNPEYPCAGNPFLERKPSETLCKPYADLLWYNLCSVQYSRTEHTKQHVVGRGRIGRDRIE